MRLIPAIDIIDGKCVRLSKGDYNTKKIYNENPLEVAKSFEVHGIEYLHLVDLDGAKSKHIVNHKILETIASKTNLKIDFGGGLKTDKDLEIAATCLPDQRKGEKIVLLSTNNLEKNELTKILTDAKINPLYHPSSVLVVDEIPKLGSGKTDFAATKKIALVNDQ